MNGSHWIEDIWRSAVPEKVKPYTKNITKLVRRLLVEFQSINARVNPAPVIILGNQKSGTTAIAALLAEIAGKTVALDLKKEYFSSTRCHRLVFNGQMPFSKMVDRNRLDFSKDIVKEANLTTIYPAVVSYFPESSFVFICRDPRDNIRSILNKIKVPGHLSHLPEKMRNDIPLGYGKMLDGSWEGFKGGNYIEMLSERWKYLAGMYLENRDRMILIRYEDFLQNKPKAIADLAMELQMNPCNDISDKVNIQYQPSGVIERDYNQFFGDNLMRIEKICAGHMRELGYSTGQGIETY